MYSTLRIAAHLAAYIAVAYVTFKVSPSAGVVLTTAFFVYQLAEYMELRALTKQYAQYRQQQLVEDELYTTKGNC